MAVGSRRPTVGRGAPGPQRPGGHSRGARQYPAIVRVEQLYPFPQQAFSTELKKYPNATEIVWGQDEPQNQGAWFQIQHNLLENLEEDQKLSYAGRPASASPAVGYYAKHNEQQKALIQSAFGRARGLVLSK